ncbi:hypothetical protein COT64_00745 [Candidatus Shapirobacteria bacterium CG09_land_8_20_14_0_10_39_12]|uniref:Uncharacterized protein n=1 Tax=Candidatus Shapirobacteria bacterium CG09_land_8_20_14_0_10_39_12 TaxID=1974885 RepID=A0A2H0WQ67_9BACT|nr:MAG: hypothetical protein COT64_00745 [Candidatus Shapirobacteria bacterium CG09_land_8_20_14_0_10_39_12]
MSIKINKEQPVQCNLGNLLKYCLGYIKLINPALSRYKIFTEPLEPDIFDSDTFFNLEINGDNSILINLKEFYELNPKDLTEENQEIYLRQKSLALKLEEIKDKYKVDEYIKQVNLNFGYFRVEIPETESFLKEEINEGKEKITLANNKLSLFSDNTKVNKSNRVKGRVKNDYYPLFTIPVEISLIERKYHLGILDHNIIPNIGFLYDVLGEERFYDFADYVNNLEINGNLTLPLDKKVIGDIWEELKGRLKLSEANFDEESFDIKRFVVSLSSKSNYFLTQDLKNLVDKAEDELMDTSLGSWVSNEDLSTEEEVNNNSGELFFPFDYDKYQLRVLPIIGNKAVVIQGPPGTGKSQTIANLLCHLAANNKKVLFLSQKAQALKVVKDKLKSLGIDYLYGYVPNRFSQVYNEEEEADGASNTLSGIQEYVGFIHEKKTEESDSSVINISTSLNLFNDAVGQQRTFYYLYNQFLELKPYEVKPISEEKYFEKFTKESYKDFLNLKKELSDLVDICGNYLKDNKESCEFEKKFNLISLDKDYSELLERLVERIKKEGYDRKSAIGKLIINNIFMFRVRTLTNELPLELFEEIKKILNQNFSRAQMVDEVTKMKNFFHYKECASKAKSLSEQIELSTMELGLDSQSLTTVEKLIEKEGLDKTIELTKKYLEIQKNIKSLQLTNLNAINKNLKRVKLDRKEKVKIFIRNRVKNQLVQSTFSAGIRGILARIARALRKSKRAYRTFDLLKQDPNNFRTLKDVIPVWIMDLEDASRLIPLEKKLFDYIVLDEASQCNLAYALPAMYRSEHVVFFGDSEQMRDDSIKFKTNRSLIDLARKYDIPEHLQIKSKEDAVKSVLDIGELRGFKEITLLHHYRSPRELIGFSNEYFYSPKKKRMEVINSNYIPFENTERVMVNHFITPKREEDTSEKTNIAEAIYIAGLIKKIQSDEKTKDKSIAVLTFFNEQALLLKQTIDDPTVKVSIIEGIQGDEKDIIIYSFVISSPDEKSRYVPLSSEQGEINKELNAGRVNVAFSRARLQVHCVTSMHIEEWPDGIWIKKYLEYVENNGKVDFYSQTLKKFDSHFEEEFYYFLRSSISEDFIIQNQVESCGFKIDFVVTNSKTNKRVAIECDGPTHFEDENSDIYITSDIERQNILECAGWDFYRLTYSDWIDEETDRKRIIKDVNNYFLKPGEYLKSVKEPEIVESVQKEEIDNEIENQSFQQKGESSPGTQRSLSFIEIMRFPIDERRDLVVSKITGEIWMSEFYKTGSFIGYSNKGVGIGKDDMENFVKKATLTLKTGESSFLPWKGLGKSKVMIQKISSPSGEDTVDVRQYVESEKYTGFTRRGFRFGKRKFEEFLNQLWKSLPS